MNIDTNTRVVQAFMDLFARSDIPGLLDAMTDDATWEIVGKPELFALVGVKTKADKARPWTDLYGSLEGRSKRMPPA